MQEPTARLTAAGVAFLATHRPLVGDSARWQEKVAFNNQVYVKDLNALNRDRNEVALHLKGSEAHKSASLRGAHTVFVAPVLQIWNTWGVALPTCKLDIRMPVTTVCSRLILTCRVRAVSLAGKTVASTKGRGKEYAQKATVAAQLVADSMCRAVTLVEQDPSGNAGLLQRGPPTLCARNSI